MFGAGDWDFGGWAGCCDGLDGGWFGRGGGEETSGRGAGGVGGELR
jgi:hypothetical protein